MHRAHVIIGGGILLLVLAGTAGLSVLRYEGDEPASTVARAAAAMREAELAGGGQWAPSTMALAQEGYVRGLADVRLQSGRPGFLRDFRGARQTLEEATRHADDALRVSTRRVSRVRVAAGGLVAEARAAARSIGSIQEVVWLPLALRRDAERARALADQAGLLLDAERFEDAAKRAMESKDLSDGVMDELLERTERFGDDAELRVWREWVAEAVAWSRRTGGAAVVVDKDAHKLLLYEAGRQTMSADVELGWNNAADKLHAGDGATPEGRYRITQLKGPGQSLYHRALLIDYPNEADRERFSDARRRGAVPQGVGAGGLIEIHGDGGQGRDWTDGCVAIANATLDRLFAKVQVGTPVVIVGGLDGTGVFAAVARELAR